MASSGDYEVRPENRLCGVHSPLNVVCCGQPVVSQPPTLNRRPQLPHLVSPHAHGCGLQRPARPQPIDASCPRGAAISPDTAPEPMLGLLRAPLPRPRLARALQVASGATIRAFGAWPPALKVGAVAIGGPSCAIGAWILSSDESGQALKLSYNLPVRLARDCATVVSIVAGESRPRGGSNLPLSGKRKLVARCAKTGLRVGIQPFWGIWRRKWCMIGLVCSQRKGICCCSQL